MRATLEALGYAIPTVVIPCGSIIYIGATYRTSELWTFMLLSAVSFIGTAAWGWLLDQHPERFHAFKIQSKAEPLTTEERWECFWVSLFNVTIVSQPMSYVANYFYTPENTEFSFPKAIFDFIFCMVVADTWFYWMHRLFHQPPLYGLVHKMHHRFKSPEAVAGLYTHWLEHGLINVGSLTIGPVLCRMHYLTGLAWYLISPMSVAGSHSGFIIPYTWAFSKDNTLHDDHHRLFNVNFGIATYIWDRVMGTYYLPDEHDDDDDDNDGSKNKNNNKNNQNNDKNTNHDEGTQQASTTKFD